MILPTLPSALLELALNDLIQVENDPRYRVHMGYWHHPANFDNTCMVCFGGAVLAKSLHFPIKSNLDLLDDVPEENRNQISALDWARNSCWPDFFIALGHDPDHGALMTDITPYEDDPDDFKHDMRVAIDILKENGL